MIRSLIVILLNCKCSAQLAGHVNIPVLMGELSYEAFCIFNTLKIPWYCARRNKTMCNIFYHTYFSSQELFHTQHIDSFLKRLLGFVMKPINLSSWQNIDLLELSVFLELQDM